MSEVIKCSSCGGVNQLPDGKSRMFCAFCGSQIEKVQSSNTLTTDSNIKFKPEIIYGELAMSDRNIQSISEIFPWFSDSELKDVTKLDLSHNNITNIKGLSKFPSLTSLNLSYNKITSLDGADLSNPFNRMLYVDLSFNAFTQLLDSDLEKINSVNLRTTHKLNYSPIGYNSSSSNNSEITEALGFEINFSGNPFVSYDWVDKIDFDRILNTYNKYGSNNYHFTGKIDNVNVTVTADDFSRKVFHANSKYAKYGVEAVLQQEKNELIKKRDNENRVNSIKELLTWAFWLFVLFLIIKFFIWVWGIYANNSSAEKTNSSLTPQSLKVESQTNTSTFESPTADTTVSSSLSQVSNVNRNADENSIISSQGENATPETSSDSIMSYVNVDIRPSYKGGESEWKKYLEKELNTNVPKENNAPAGVYVANIWVVVETNGTLTNYFYEEMLGYGMTNEAIRVIPSSSLWNPAIHNGKPVRCYFKIPITFVVK